MLLTYGVIALLLAVTAAVLYSVIIYNELVRLRNENDRAWANIDVLLKQRHDEIPNLVEAVKGYMHYEKETLLGSDRGASCRGPCHHRGGEGVGRPAVTGALRSFFGVAENYPQLKANENFLKLQGRISELEERIADRREYFNNDVNTYNTRIRQSPRGLLRQSCCAGSPAKCSRSPMKIGVR